MHLSPNYAEHVVGRGIADPVSVNCAGGLDECLAAEQVSK